MLECSFYLASQLFLTMQPSDSPLAAFRREYFGPIDRYLAWREGYEADATRLDALNPAERRQAEEELLAALRSGNGDARAILGLSHLRSDEALPLLHYCLRTGTDAYYALTAIARITPAGLDRTLLAEVLRTATNRSQLMYLLLALPDGFALPQVGSAVASAVLGRLTHPDYLVRYHALNALRRLYGVPGPGPQAPVAAIRADELFALISREHAPRAYRKAQHLLLKQVPAATLHEFPLVLS